MLFVPPSVYYIIRRLCESHLQISRKREYVLRSKTSVATLEK